MTRTNPLKKLSCQGAMVLCNKHGLPEGSKQEMIDTLIEHFAEPEPEPVITVFDAGGHEELATPE